MGVRVPHRLGLAALVPLALRAPPGGDGVNDLPISEGVPGPVEVGLKVAWGPGGAGADDEPQRACSLVCVSSCGRTDTDDCY